MTAFEAQAPGIELTPQRKEALIRLCSLHAVAITHRMHKKRVPFAHRKEIASALRNAHKQCLDRITGAVDFRSNSDEFYLIWPSRLLASLATFIR